MIYIKNSTEIQKIYIPKNDGMPCSSSHKGSGYDEGYHDGYVDGVGDGEQAIIATFTSATITENGEYGSSASPYSSVTVSIDTASTYNEGYESGVTDGEQNIINTFTSDTLTVNGTYGSSAHPYSSVTVDVDLDAPYESGYTDGYASGWSSGYSSGFSSGETTGYDEGYDSGYTSGMSSGYSKGWSEGFPEGQQDIINTFTSETLTVNGTYGSSAHPYSSVTVDVDMDAPYESGYTDGYESGYTSGYSSGYTSGETDGFNSGYTSGVTDGEQNIIDTFTAMTANTNGVYGSSAQPLSSITVDVPTGETYNIEEAKPFTASTNGNYTIVPSTATTVVNESYDNDDERYYITATTSNYPSTGYFELLKVEDEFDDSKGYIEIYLYDGRIDYDASSWHGGEVYEWGTTRNEIELYIKNANRDFTWTRLGDYSMVYDLMSSVTLTVDVDTASTYSQGYQSGLTDGEQNIIGTFTADTATTNGVYGSSANPLSSITVNIDQSGSYQSGYTDGYASGHSAGFHEGQVDIYETFTSMTVNTNGTYGSFRHPLSSITVSIPAHSSTTEYDYNTIYAKYNFASSGSKPILSRTYYVEDMYVDGSSTSEVPSTTRNFSAGEHSIAFVSNNPNQLNKYCFYMSGTELTELVVGKAFNKFSNNYGGSLTNCNKLSAITLLYDGVVNISSGEVATFANNGVMYVPASRMTAYVQSQNWSYLFTNKGWTIEMIEDTQVAYNEGFDDGLGVGYESGASSVNLGQKTITENGTYHASDDGFDGYDMIEVDVSSSDYIFYCKGLYFEFPFSVDENISVTTHNLTAISQDNPHSAHSVELFQDANETHGMFVLYDFSLGCEELHIYNDSTGEHETVQLANPISGATLIFNRDGVWIDGTLVSGVNILDGWNGNMYLFGVSGLQSDAKIGEIMIDYDGSPMADYKPSTDLCFKDALGNESDVYPTIEPYGEISIIDECFEQGYASGVTDIIGTFTAMTANRNGVYGSSAHPLSSITVALPFTSATFTENGTYYAQNGDATFLDYIETDGHDILFDTGVKMTSTGQTVILDFMPLTGDSHYDAYLSYLSQQDNDSVIQLWLRQGSATNLPNGQYWYSVNGEIAIISGLFSANTRAYAEMGSTGITVNGISSASAQGNLMQTDSNIYINGNMFDNENYRCPYARYYGFKLIDDDGVTALADLRPALDGDIPCFYDMVSGNFIHQFGTGHTSSGSVISRRFEGFTAVTVNVDTASTYQSGYSEGYQSGYTDGAASASGGSDDLALKLINRAGTKTNIEIPSGITYIGWYSFARMECMTSVTIPNTVTMIDDYAFYNCKSLSSLTIPNSVTWIGSRVFSSNYSLTAITIPNNVTEMGEYCFDSDNNLLEITFPDSLGEIRSYMCRYCSSLSSATIGSGITSIQNYAFQYCNNLKTLYFRTSTPPTLGHNRTFVSGTTYAASGDMYVPSGSSGTYSTWATTDSYAKKSFSGWTIHEYEVQ